MALFSSILRRPSSSLFSFPLHTVGSTRTFHSPISTVPPFNTEITRECFVPFQRFSTATATAVKPAAADTVVRVLESEIKAAKEGIQNCQMQAEEEQQRQHKENGGNYRTLMPDSHLLWAGASVAQFGWAVVLYRKGSGTHSTSMPFRAFAVASLIVGAGATAAFAGIRASGIHKVEDLIQLGADIRTGVGVRPRGTTEGKG